MSVDPLCSACGAVFHARDDTHCDACGAARSAVVGPVAHEQGVRAHGSWRNIRRLCGWCGAATPDLERASCGSCGGPLPSVPPRILADLSLPAPAIAPPAAPPRRLPDGYAFRVTVWKNVEVMIGIIFVLVGVPTAPLFGIGLIFVGAGIALGIHGHRRATRQIQALEHGVPFEGTITAVAKDVTKSINNEHPWKLEFRFEGAHGPVDGHVESWDEMTAAHDPGERVWVVAAPHDERICSVWPPMR